MTPLLGKLCFKAFLMLYERRLRQVNIKFTDVLNIVANPLKVLRNEQQVRRAGCCFRILDHHLDQFAKHLVIDLVDFLVPLNNFAR